MEETHPPEIPRKPPVYENLGPTYEHSLVFELIDKDWVCLYTFRRTNAVSPGAEAEEASPVSSIRWHPIYAHDLLIGFSDGSAHAASFLDQSGEKFGKVTTTKVIDFGLVHFTTAINWKYTAISKTASKLVGLVGSDVFIYKEPFSDVGYDLTVCRPLPERALQHEPLNVWYLDNPRTLLVSHPLAISWVSIREKTLTHSIPFRDTRALTFTAISPSHELLVAINSRGDAALFSVKYKQFLQVLREGLGPYRPLVSAIFYGHSSLVLAYADRPDLEVIPELNFGGNQSSRVLALLRHNKLPYPPGSPLKIYDSIIIWGQGHILVAKPNRKPGSYLNIVIPSNEQFYVDEASGEPEINNDQVSPDPVPVVLEAPTIPVETEAAPVSNSPDPVLVTIPVTEAAALPVKYWKIPGFPVGFAKW